MAKNESLTKYNAKRNFKKTAEPEGILGNGEGFRFLIQKHEASHLHYDFRLELDGVLKSWAVPKGPSPDPNVKRLAMQVEDHPVAYGDFEGIIPAGEYGGGTVMLWDEGTWEPVDDPREGLAKGKMVFKIHGHRMKGEWTIFKTHYGKDKRGSSWLLMKHKNDDEVRVGDNDALTTDNITSIKTGRTMEEIAANKTKVWKSNRAGNKIRVGPAPVKKPAKPVRKAAGKVLPLPAFKEPQLATLSTAAPKGKEWVHEVKFDGYRMLAYVDSGHVTIYSRNGKDWTETFRTIADRLEGWDVQNAIIDGELVVSDAHGKSNFSELKNALSNDQSDRFQYYAFDLLRLDGKDLTKFPLLERKAALAQVIADNAAKSKNQPIIYSDHFTQDADAFLQNVCSLQLEGMISKRADAPYHSGRSKIWLKTKCHKRQEFVIGGYTPSTTGLPMIGSLLLGYYEGKDFVYAGRVGTGFSQKLGMQIYKTLKQMTLPKMAYTKFSEAGARGPGWKRGVFWVEPKFVCEVEFTEWTEEGALRHPSFQGMREDKPAKDIIREVALSPKVLAPAAAAEVKADKKTAAKRTKQRPVPAVATKTAKKGTAVVGGITISHPERVIYPESGFTKLQLAEYYYSVADKILPHIINRPISMVRCPEGIGHECFFQRHVGLGKSEHIHEVDVKVKGTGREYVMINDVKGLISLIQWGVIEIHPWQCSVDDLEKPDRIIFDLDPDPSVTWKDVVEATFEVKRRMEELGLKTFLKTTGGKGLHVVIPITPNYSFATIKAFTRLIAEFMEHDAPGKYISTMSKEKRKGKIFIDYLRNDVTSTAAATFSARARPGATVSTPIAWSDLKASLKPSAYTIETVPTLIKKQKSDPWKDFGKTKQKINVKFLKAMEIKT